MASASALSTAPQLSRIATTMVPSEIRAVMDQALERPNVVRLEVGQPDFPTPPHIVAAADAAARRGETGYAPNAGIPELCEALAAKVTTRNGYAPSSEQLVVTNGATSGIFTALRVLTDPGDEILLPDPAWPTFRMIAELLGLRIRSYRLRPDTGHLPDPDELETLAGPRTKALLLVSPSNPLGVVLPGASAQALVDFAQRRDLWVLADETYDEIVFDGAHVSVAAVAPSERLVSIYSCSKVYAMCGWRIGYVVAPTGVAKILSTVQEPVTSSVNTPAQHAALAAISGPQEPVARMRDAYHRRRDAALAACARQGLGAVRPAGAFYLWIDVSSAGVSSRELTQTLLRERDVAVAPGTAFGETGATSVRVSLAASERDIVHGIQQLGELCKAAAGA